jgi:hypothetical protein
MGDVKLVVIASDINIIGPQEIELMRSIEKMRGLRIVGVGDLQERVNYENVLQELKDSLPDYKLSLIDIEPASDFEVGYETKKSFSNSIKPRNSRYVGNDNGRKNYSKGKR